MRPVTGPVWLPEEFFGLSIWEISAPLAGMKSEKHNQNGTGTYINQARTNHLLLSFSRVGAKIWNGIPPELRKLRKTRFKRKLTHLLLKILETEEMNVDLHYIDLSSLHYFCTD